MEQKALKGTPQEQAEQFFKMLKEKHLDAEILGKIIPTSTAFFQELSKCIQKQIDADTEDYKTCAKYMEQLASNLVCYLKAGTITQDERKEIIDLLGKLNEKMVEIEKEKVKEGGKTKRFLAACGTFALTVIIFIASGGKSKA